MKNFLSILILFSFTQCVTQQQIPTQSYPSPFTFSNAKDASGSKEELFVRAHEWLAKTFVSSKEVLQLVDKQAGKLIGKGVFKVGYDYVNFTISIDVKDGKYRCVFSDFIHEGGIGTAFNGNTEQRKSGGYLEQEKPNPGVPMKTWYRCKDEAMNRSNDLLKSLDEAMQNTKADTF